MADGVILFRPDAVRELDQPAADARLEQDEALTGDADGEIQRLEAEIAAKRERVVASFGELRRRVEVATDWRGWVRKHPVAWIAGAVSIGFVIGSLGSLRSSEVRGGRSSSRW